MEANNNSQDNMSVEDILSSIKDILEDDNQPKDESSSNNNKDHIIDVDFEEEDDDDIFELSEEQIIDQISTSAQEEVFEINTFDNKEDNWGTNQDIFAPKEDDDTIKPFFSKEEVSSANINTEEYNDDIKEDDTSMAEGALDIDNLITSLDDVINDSKDNDANITKEAEHTLIKEAQPNVATTTDNSIAQSNADTSVEILNNFAKMFSKTPINTPEVQIDDNLIDAILQKEVAKKIIDINFDNIANAQIKKWLNDNLSIIVEKVVKEKLEEVLSKNGQ